MYDKLKEKVIEFILNNKLICFLLALSFAGVLFSVSFVYLNKCPKCKECRVCKSNVAKTKKSEESSLVVDVKGEVNSPGVYTLKEGLSVIDAINASGGLKDDANTKNINLSKKLEDEMVIYVPSDEEVNNESQSINENIFNSYNTNSNSSYGENSSSQKSLSGKININTASESDLTLLSGIGPSKAKKIIEYRNNNGNFKSIEEIKNVSGIGDKAFEKIKDFITI